MRKLESLIEERLETVLGDVLSDVIDRALANAIDRVIAKALGLEVETTEAKPTKAKPKAKAKATKAKAELEAKAEVSEDKAAEVSKADPEDKAKPKVDPKDEAEAKLEALMARVQGRTDTLGEKYGPMLTRRAKAITKHALDPVSALAVLAAWVESSQPEDIIAVLRGSEKLPSGEVLSGWRYLAAKLGIPVKP